MSFSSIITLILISLIIIQEFHSIDGSVEEIYEKLKQEVEDLIDSQDYESVNEILKDSKVKVKYFDYYVPTTVGPTTMKTKKATVTEDNTKTRSAGVAPAKDSKEESGDEGSSSSSIGIIMVVVLFVVVAIIIAVVVVFIFVKRSSNGKLLKKKPKRNASIESLASIETVASDTGKPLHPKGGKKPVPKKK